MEKETSFNKKLFQERFLEIVGNETQDEISKKIHSTRQNVGKLISGQTIPNSATLKGICDAYNVSADYLLGRTETNSPDVEFEGVEKFTGLSTKAVETIKHFCKDETFIVNAFIENENFFYIIENISDLKYYSELIINFGKELKENIQCDTSFNDRDWITTIYNRITDFNKECDVFRYNVHRNIDMFIDSIDLRIQSNEIKQSQNAYYEYVSRFVDRLASQKNRLAKSEQDN